MPAEFPHALVAHPSAAATAVGAFRVDASFALRARRLVLRYRVRGPLNELCLDYGPGTLPGDRLWMHSCFEAFVGAGPVAYREFNFSANGQWATFDFSNYRHPVQSSESSAKAPRVESSRDGDAFFLAVELAASALPVAACEQALGLSAVLERRDGSLAYFALAHAGDKPDFHDRRGWRCRLAAGQTA